MSKSPVVYAPAVDPAMSEATREAQRTFRYFWRELTWEQRRIVPGLEIAAIKAAFADPGAKTEEVEHMWLGDVTFDGDVLEATLLNRPNTVRSVAEGDRVPLSLDRLEDWMYAMSGQVYGGHTVGVLRTRMTPDARRDHDDAWGFDFGDPSAIRLVPAWPGNATHDPDVEHPMSEMGSCDPRIRPGSRCCTRWRSAGARAACARSWTKAPIRWLAHAAARRRACSRSSSAGRE